MALILAILGVYPGLLAIFHLTPFDLGLVYAATTFLPVLYFFCMTGYIGLRLPAAAVWRYALFGAGAALALLSLTNVWHGYFAVFEQHQPGQANHMLDDLEPGIGMGLMHALSLILVASAMLLSVVQLFRSRLRPVQVLLAVILPALALWSFTSTQRWSVLADAGVSGFILTTTIVLLVANYALMRNHFLEIRVVTRSKLIHLLPDAIVLLSKSGKILDANPAFAALVNSSLDELIDEQIVRYLPQIDQEIAADTINDFELDLSEPGEPLFLQASVAATGQAMEAGQYLVVLRDITESQIIQAELLERDRQLQVANAALKELSATDALTGLPNRRALMQDVEQAVALFQRNGREFALLTLDIDHFKTVNDRFGHATGDEALCHVAQILKEQCRSTDSLARYGGEEFVILLGEVGNEETAPAAERFRVAVETNPLTLSTGDKLELTISVGGTTYEDGMTTDALLQAADSALYEAKNAGRNRVCIA
ncbi:MAG: hypothetical protein Cons2KO_34020 [Congregibacter sp.]